MAGNFTLFTNDQGSAAGPNDYVRDTFSDESLQATNNTGYTDNASTNPTSAYFNNTDAPKYGYKKLFLKDVIEVKDPNKWVNGKKTYECIFHENYPNVKAYIYGKIRSSSKFDVMGLTVNQIGEGISIVGQVRLAGLITAGDDILSSTISYAVDGGAATTASLSSPADLSVGGTNRLNYGHFRSYFGSQTLQSDDLHQFSYTCGAVVPLNINGIIILENTDSYTFKPGTTYVDKSKITTTSGLTSALSTFGSSLGGTDLFYKTQSSGYSLSSLSATSVISIAQGSSGTNLLSVSTGHGASFPAGSGVVVALGASSFLATVTSVSTDTLTVFPTLPIGYSSTIYRAWQSTPTLTISSTFYQLSETLDFSRMYDFDREFLDSKTNRACWFHNVSLSIGASFQFDNCLTFAGGSGAINVAGYFQAAEIELAGPGTFNATLTLNGLPTWSVNEGVTFPIKRTVVSDLGPGFNMFSLGAAAAMTSGVQIRKINLYKRNPSVGVSFGQLASIDTLQSTVYRSAQNASIMALGMKDRIAGNNVFLQGGWIRNTGGTLYAGNSWVGASSNTAFSHTFYGDKYAIVGIAPSGGTLTLDGVGVALTFNSVVVASVGASLHTLSYTGAAGVTVTIEAIDEFDTKKELKNLQNVLGYTNSAALDVMNLYLMNGGTDNNSGGNIRVFNTTAKRTLGNYVNHIRDTGAGSKFIVGTNGMYEITYADVCNTASRNIAITSNSIDTSSGEWTLNLRTKIIAASDAPTGFMGFCSASEYLRAGDVLTCFNSGAGGTGASMTGAGYFRIKRIG